MSFLVFHHATRPKSLPTLSLSHLHNVIPLKDIPLTWTWVVIFTESKAHFACAAVTSRMIDTTLMTGVMSSDAFIMILENRKKFKRRCHKFYRCDRHTNSNQFTFIRSGTTKASSLFTLCSNHGMFINTWYRLYEMCEVIRILKL